jgi:PAS domain S-box-containing protein
MTIRSAVLLAVLMSAGFLGNYYTLPLFFGADFLFGSIAVLLVLYFYGLGWGLLAALVAYGYTWVLWGHPYGFVNFMIEALFVGLFLKRGRRNLLVLDSLFWLCLGLSMIWIEYGYILQMDGISTAFIMLKQSINGIFNAMLVSLAICFLPLGKLFQRPQFSTNISLREYLFNLLVMMVLLPALLLTIMETRKEKEDLEANVVEDLQSLSDNLEFHLDSWFKQHVQALNELAGLAGISSMTPNAPLQHETEILKQAFTNFYGLHVENAEGRTIAFSPRVNEKGEFTIGHDFSDRSWFKKAKATQKLVVSEVFKGRATVFSPILVLSVPIIRENRWLGTATGVLDLSMVKEMLKPYSLGKPMIITLTDSQGKIIASTATERSSMQLWDRKKTGVSVPLSAQMYRWQPDDPKLPSMTRWKQSCYVQEISLGPELPWKLIIEVPVGPLQHALYSIYVNNLTIMAILTTLALLFSLLLSRWLTRPLVQLSQVTANLPEKLSEAQNLDWPTSSALEINALIANSTSMAHTLEENFHNLQVQRDELRQVNRELNREIQERQRAEGSLRDNEQFLADIFDSIQDGLCILDCDLNILRVNPAIEKLAHTSVLAGKKCYEVYHSRWEPCDDCPVRKTLRTGEPAHKVVTLTPPDGSTLFMEIHAFPVLNPATGQVDRVIEYVRDVTERQQAKEALEEEAIRRRILVEQSRDGIVVLNQNGKVYEANQRYAEMLGYSPEEVRELYVWDWDTQWTREELLEQVRSVDVAGDHFETRHRRKDGTFIDVEISTNGAVLAAKKLIFCVCRDISDRKAAEEDLRRIRERMQLALEGADLGTWDWNNKTGAVTFNERWAWMLSYRLDEIEPQFSSWERLAHPDGLPGVREVLNAHLEGKTPFYEAEYRLKHKSGEWVWVLDRGKVIERDAKGEPVRTCGTHQDITARKQAAANLRQSEEKYQMVFDKAPLGIMHYDQKGTIMTCNDKFAEIIGAPKEKFIGFNMIRQLRDGKMREVVNASLQGKVAHYEGDYLSVTAGKITPVRAIFQPIFSPDGIFSGGVTIFEDVTERKQAEQERLRLDKLESLGVLAGGIAHDFNNILMIILGSISLANMVTSFSEAQERLTAAEAACGQGQSLAQQLLTFAKGGAPIKEPQDLKEIVNEAARLALSGSQARVEVSLPENLWEVEVDRGQMHQVFSNLLINADQAMPTGGLIQIQAENLAESEASHLSLPPGKHVAVTLTDQGLGIPPEHLERIFDPYFTTKQKGSGLGLATVHSIVTQHGGRITVDPHSERGTSFRLYLPAREGTVPEEKRREARPMKGKGRILLMDDEPLVRQVVGRMLQALGYEPVFAQEGREAVELYARSQTSGEPFTAVILDLTIPGGMGGMAAIQQILAQDPQVKAIVSSGYGGDSIMADYKSHGFRGVIAKPYGLEELGKVLHEVLNA